MISGLIIALIPFAALLAGIVTNIVKSAKSIKSMKAQLKALGR